MSRYTDRHVSRALAAFVKGIETLPYVAADGTRVTSVRPRQGVTWGAPALGGNIHLISDLAGAWTTNGLIVGARWMCGAGSIGVHTYDPERYMARMGRLYDHLDSQDELVCMKCRSARDGITEWPCVYRVWSRGRKRLLYIGSTKNWDNRRNQHRANTWWWALAQHVDVTDYPTMEAALTAEAEAIRAECPQMNVQHNRGSVSA